MASTHRLYDVLGVARDASDTDVKRAYKVAAMKHHPDKGGDPERFKELSAAYEVLSDAARRAEYNAIGDAGMEMKANGGGAGPPPFDPFAAFHAAFAGFGSFGPPPGGGFGPGTPPPPGNVRAPRRLNDTVHAVTLELEEAFRGVTKTLRISIKKRCPCVRACLSCRGAGFIQEVAQHGMMRLVNTRPCQACSSSGVAGAEPACSVCCGRGDIHETRTVQVELPPGVRTGHSIRVPGAGQQPVLASSGDTPGDLVIEARVAPHPTLTRIDDDLQVDVTVTLGEALLGKQIKIDRFGDLVEFDTASTLGVLQPKKCYVLHGKGMPKTNGPPTTFGDLRLRFDIKWPSTDLRIPPAAAAQLAAALREAGLEPAAGE